MERGERDEGKREKERVSEEDDTARNGNTGNQYGVSLD